MSREPAFAQNVPGLPDLFRLEGPVDSLSHASKEFMVKRAVGRNRSAKSARGCPERKLTESVSGSAFPPYASTKTRAGANFPDPRRGPFGWLRDR